MRTFSLSFIICLLLGALVFCGSVSAEPVKQGWPIMCTDYGAQGAATINGTKYITCKKLLAGSAPGTPVYVEITEPIGAKASAASLSVTPATDGIFVTRLRDGDGTTLADVLDAGLDNAPNTLNGAVTYSFNSFWDGSAWDRVTAQAAGDALSATQQGADTLSFNLFYDGTQFRRWLGAAANSDAVAATTVAPYQLSLGLAYDIDNTQWHRLSFLNSHADNQNVNRGGVWGANVLYLYDGATLDMALAGTSGGLQSETVNWPSAYSEGSAHVSTNRKSLEKYEDEQDTADVAAVATTILDEQDISGYDCCFYIYNTDATQALTDLDVETNFENANWATQAIELTSGCSDTLGAGLGCVYCNNDAVKWVRVRATGNANPNEVDMTVALECVVR